MHGSPLIERFGLEILQIVSVALRPGDLSFEGKSLVGWT